MILASAVCYFFPSWACDENSICIAQWYDLMFIRLWGTRHGCYLYDAISEGQPVITMPWGSKLMNKWWWLLCFWGLYSGRPPWVASWYTSPLKLRLVHASTASSSSYLIGPPQQHSFQYKQPSLSPCYCFLLEPVMKITCALLNDMIWCSLACEVLGMSVMLLISCSFWG